MSRQKLRQAVALSLSRILRALFTTSRLWQVEFEIHRFEKSRIIDRIVFEASQVNGIIRRFTCSRTICLVDQVKLIRYTSITQLRESICSRFRELVIALIRSFCDVILSKCRSSNDFPNEFSLEEDLTLLQIAPVITPFKTQLIVENESLVMSPSIDSIAVAVLGVIDRFIDVVNSLAQLSLEMIDCSSKFTQSDVLPKDHPELVAY